MTAVASTLARIVVAPARIDVSQTLDALELTSANDELLRLPAGRLRAACRCAHCIRARIDGVFPERFEGLAIVEIRPIGGYAINITFSDGHNRGIYPWSLLQALSAA